MSGTAADATNDPAVLARWVGRSRTERDTVTAAPLAALAATLDRDDPRPRPGTEMPPCGHWIYFWPLAKQSELGEDGHEARGGFLPPVALPRRMWAGSRIAFETPLAVGDEIERVSRIQSVTPKTGRSGPMVFVTVRHEISGPEGLALVEEQDIVYREGPKPGAAAPAPRPTPRPTPRPASAAEWRRTVRPDPVLLFRYSALIFNGHRIHFDLEFCREREGYPGLVVHGPLTATLLMDLFRRHRPEARVTGFSFRGVSPLFDTQPFDVAGVPDDAAGAATLWAETPDGALAMEARVEYR